MEESKEFVEWLCTGMDKREIEDDRCIIHRPHFKFDLQKDCHYLSKFSEYIDFIEEE